MAIKITKCKLCNKEIEYTTKKPSICKECKIKKYGTRKYYKKPKKSIPTKSIQENMMDKILNGMLPNARYIDGGYYSFLLSPKNKPMQLDRYYPRLHLAFEYNGNQHNKDNAFFYSSKEEFDYQQTCDKLKNDLCKRYNITLIYINHNEFINKELIINKLIESNMYEYIKNNTKLIE